MKKNCLIINPGVITERLYANKSFIEQHCVMEWDSRKSSFSDLKSTLSADSKIDQIILDEFDDTTIDNLVLANMNKIRLNTPKFQSMFEVYETYEKRVPIVYAGNHWHASKDIVNLRISVHVQIIKRIIDFSLSLFLLPFALVFIFIGGLLIKLTSKGPIFFTQERAGKLEKPFKIYKLRTMRHSSEVNKAFTVEDDARIFPVGKFLRKSKIDELPQLFNIIVGDMSLIGPRPERIEIVEKLIDENPYYELRHLVRPGITGWAQVNNPTATPEDNYQKLEYDLYYIKNGTFWLDLKIALMTINVIWHQKSL